MTQPLDLSRPLQLSDGRPARLLCSDAKGEYPIVVLVSEPGGVDSLFRSSIAGVLKYIENVSLINALVEHEYWRYFNVYDNGRISGVPYMTRVDADIDAPFNGTAIRVACVRVQIRAVEGTFDD